MAGTALPANVVVKAPDVNAPEVRQAIGLCYQRLCSRRTWIRSCKLLELPKCVLIPTKILERSTE